MEFVYTLQIYFVSGDYLISDNICIIAANCNSYTNYYFNKTRFNSVRVIHTESNEKENNKLIFCKPKSNETQKIDSSFISSSVINHLKKDTISNILNNSKIDINIIKDIESSLEDLFKLLQIISSDFSNNQIKDIKNEVYEELGKIGLNTVRFKKEYKLYVKNNKRLKMN